MIEPSAQAQPWRETGLAIAFFAVVVVLQILSGAYHSEFAGYPDESAHYVTSLMVRDFIVGFDYSDPMKFALNYYDHYPKVAFGHWPPLLYALGGVWMFLFTPARPSVLIGLAVLTTLLACLTHCAVKRRFGWAAGALSGLLLICLPLIQTYSDEIMAESLLAIVSFAAAIYFARYLERVRWQDSAMFGVFATLAILTKGSGWDLALIPVFAILLTRRFSLILRWSFWLPALIVGLSCIPWQWTTLKLVQRGWDGGTQPNLDYTSHALPAFLLRFVTVLGWGLLSLAVIGIAVAVAIPFFRSLSNGRTQVDSEWATMFSLILAAWLFHSLVPAGVEDRKLIIAIPALIMFVFAGGQWLAHRLHWKPFWIAIAAALIFALRQFAIPSEIHYGYIEAARFIQQRSDLRNAKVLVSSQRDGEGMLISEMAMTEQRPGHKIMRGTKVLSQTDWNGNVSATYYPNPEALLNYLHEAGVNVVVSDTLQPMVTFAHQRVLSEMLAKYPNKLKLIATFRADTPGAVNVYSVD